jgi:PAS domain S-box-containing protein
MSDANQFSPELISPSLGLPLDADTALVAILESITDAVFVMDRQWRFVYVNAPAEAMLQRPRADLLGMDAWAAFPEAAKSIFDEQYHQVMETRIATTFEAFYAPLDLWVEARVYPAPVGITIYCHDITERRRADAARRESESRVRLLADHAQDLIFRYRYPPNPGFEYVSPSATNFCGYTPEEHYADPMLLTKLIHPDDQVRFRASLSSGTLSP